MMKSHMELANRGEVLELIFNSLSLVSWKNKKGKYLGANLNQVQAFGFETIEQFIGKTVFDLVPDQKLAKLIDEAEKKIMDDGIPVNIEETFKTNIGNKSFASQKIPMRDKNNKVIGLLIYSIDITNLDININRIEAEKLYARKIAHDMRSPLMNLRVIAQNCIEIPEAERISLREVATSIDDVAHNVLSRYLNNSESIEFKPVLLSTTLLQILSEKKYEYENKPIKFKHTFSSESNFIFILAEKISFKRMISSIINDAIKYSDQSEIIIEVKLEVENSIAKIQIEDNSRGISRDMLTKIKQDVSIPSDDGRGSVYTRIKEALEINQGTIGINSVLANVPEVFLNFTVTTTPDWFVDRITLGSHDIVIILDDDTSTHNAWKISFNDILKNNPNIQLRDFHEGEVAINYINSLSKPDKSRVFLLVDYELLKQNLTGIDVIVKTGISRAVVVTSHYTDNKILEESVENNARVLPKQLVSEISITIDNDLTQTIEPNGKAVDLVIVDDNQRVGKIFKSWSGQNVNMDFYSNPHDFLDKVEKYPINTKIYLDYDFKSDEINGIILAEKLHAMGYTNLCLLTGRDFDKDDLPGYLELLEKHKIKNIRALFNIK